MVKAIEFKIKVPQVGGGKPKTRIYYAKSLIRLLAAIPKPIKKKWEEITFIDKDGFAFIIDRSFLEIEDKSSELERIKKETQTKLF